MRRSWDYQDVQIAGNSSSAEVGIVAHGLEPVRSCETAPRATPAGNKNGLPEGKPLIVLVLLRGVEPPTY